ncbi:hypothetical protein WL10_19415 [Burkholderia ubonensis]|nr:hypothetical protein WL10_19415 [Burkholderia ubonensis]
MPQSPSIRHHDLRFISTGRNSPLHRSSKNPAFNRKTGLLGRGTGIAPLPLVKEIRLMKDSWLITDFPLFNERIELQLAYSKRTLLPAKVRAFIDRAVE